MGTQIMGLVCIIAWTGATSFAVLLPLRYAGFLRWGDLFQEEGADKMEHSPPKRLSANYDAAQDQMETGKVAEEPTSVVPTKLSLDSAVGKEGPKESKETEI